MRKTVMIGLFSVALWSLLGMIATRLIPEYPQLLLSLVIIGTLATFWVLDNLLSGEGK